MVTLMNKFQLIQEVLITLTLKVTSTYILNRRLSLNHRHFLILGSTKIKFNVTFTFRWRG